MSLEGDQYLTCMSLGGDQYLTCMSLGGDQYMTCMSLGGDQYLTCMSLEGDQYLTCMSLGGDQYLTCMSLEGDQYLTWMLLSLFCSSVMGEDTCVLRCLPGDLRLMLHEKKPNHIRTCSSMSLLLILSTQTLLMASVPKGVTHHFVRRKCIDFRGCEQRGGLTSQSHKMKFTTDCCSTDNCSVPIPMLPPDNSTFNGLFCPASSSFLGDDYEPGHAMKCSGDEDQCFQFRSEKSQQPVNMLLCNQCHGSIHTQCENYTTCGPEHDACVTVILKSTRAGGKIVLEMMKRCGFSLECETAGTITSTLMISSRNTSCCYTDNCISPIPDVPSKSNKTNGHICESCYFTEHGSCKDGERVACTGDATRCITSTMKIMNGPDSRTIFHRGCADPGLCSNANISVTYDQRTIQETILCSVPGISSFHPPIVLFGFFVLMSLFTVMQ
ncbi:uncharacterized protein [Engystomops pustulosus]|uniref:uncharacterized protein isoform X2 n=1 Tax=Engystomops pustulosus TaxID=76066 RepID=UPI003AFB41EC